MAPEPSIGTPGDEPGGVEARIDLGALQRNVRRIREQLGERRLIAVVKADAYGLGLTRTVPHLEAAGVDAFAIATLEEAASIRETGSLLPILLLSPLPVGGETRLPRLQVQPTVSCAEDLERFGNYGMRRGEAVEVQLKIDTGMGRLGVWHAEAAALIAQALDHDAIRLRGLFTHFSSADDDPGYTDLQSQHFQRVLAQVREDGFSLRGLWLHAENSAAWLAGGLPGELNAVRVGIIQQGVAPANALEARLRPFEEVVQIRAPIIAQTEHEGCHCAVVHAGYANGVPSRYARHGSVLIEGEDCPIVGKIAAFTLRVRLPEALAQRDLRGQSAVLLGESSRFPPDSNQPNQPTPRITVGDFAQRAGQRRWEVLCSLTPHARRIYVDP